MLTRWRALYEKYSIPFGKASLRLGLTPNFWTLFSLFSGALAAAGHWPGFYWLGIGDDHRHERDRYAGWRDRSRG